MLNPNTSNPLKLINRRHSLALLALPLASAFRAMALPLPTLPDVPLIDQDGQSHLFFTDLIKGKIALLNFAYTSCNTLCPIQGQRFAQVQTLLGSRLGKDVFLLTVTLDPVNDTPATLKAWAAAYGAKPGWTLLTGDPANVQRVLGIFIAGPQVKDYNHSPIVVAINEPLKQIKADFSIGPASWLFQYATTWRTSSVTGPTKTTSH